MSRSHREPLPPDQTSSGRSKEAAAGYGLGLTEADAWPVLRSHLCLSHCQGLTAISSLMYGVDAEGIRDARDPAALADQPTQLVRRRRSRILSSAPLGSPHPVAPLSRFSVGDYLTARHDVIVQLADQVRQDAETRLTLPAWAAICPSNLVAESFESSLGHSTNGARTR
jgi:hypothetical protein